MHHVLNGSDPLPPPINPNNPMGYENKNSLKVAEGGDGIVD